MTIDHLYSLLKWMPRYYGSLIDNHSDEEATDPEVPEIIKNMLLETGFNLNVLV